MSRRFVIVSTRLGKESEDIHPTTTGSGKKEALVALAVPGPNEKWRGEWGQVAKAAGEG